jgi:short-subunit dehydrogenase
MGRKRSLQGLRAVVTGASQGIGRALAIEGVRRGMVVVAQARSADLLELLKAEVAGMQLSGALHTIVGDVTSETDRQNLATFCLKELGGLDILVNNAGIGATGHFIDGNQEQLRKIFEVNVFGLAETTRSLLPLLKLGNSAQVINIGSIVGERAFPARSDYSSSKFAVHAFTDGLRSELSKDLVDVLMVAPGLTQTNFSQNMLKQSAKVQLDHMRGMTSEQVAEAVWDASAKGKDRVFLTRQGRLLLLVNKLFPWLVDRIMRRKVRTLFKEEIAAREAGTPVSV